MGHEPSLYGSQTRRSEETMKKVYDFSKGKRGAVVPTPGKTRITIYMDDAVLKRFKAQSEKSGKGYQTLINEALKSYLGLSEQPVTQELVRKIVREELASHG
jgi:uncharacterized protein (DUF4415 family)